jgi:primary-amine oxidase
VPSNYFDIDLSRRSRGNVRVNYKSGAVTAVENAGRAQVCESDLWNYLGDIAVRKFPFDPNNPYYDTEDLADDFS